MGNLLLDTNVVSELMRDEPSSALIEWFSQNNKQILFSCAVTKAEILLGIALLPEGKRKKALAKDAELTFAEDFTGECLPFDEVAAEYYAYVISMRKNIGRPIAMADAQIASIALSQNLAVVTRNTKDFEQIQGLTVINPWLSQNV